MKALLAILWLVFSAAAGFAQEQAVITTPPISGWTTILPAGTLEQQPEIIVADGGFAVAADSFVDESWYFDSPWVLLNPATGEWSDFEFPAVESPLLELDDNPIARLDIAGLFPDDPGLKFQLVDNGRKAVFLLHAGELLADHARYDGVVIVNPAARTAERLDHWMCRGPRNSGDIVWDFPEENLSVSCSLLIWYEGDSYRIQNTSEYIGQNWPNMLHLLSTSPDNRYWILRERFYYDPWYGDYYLYDRDTGITTILLWADWGVPYHFVVWLDASTLIVNSGHFILFLDAVTGERRKLLEDELEDLAAYSPFYPQLQMSSDGQWLVTTTDDGSLLLRSLSEAMGRP
ncbi:MAG: hypothetical protein F4X02_14390 [Chloroflexi bacterium]|nr:hypothetical protein [Chloroflexota bacterium]